MQCEIFKKNVSFLGVSHQIPVHSYHDLHLGVIVTDSNGRRFNNFSSLAFDWELSDLTVAEFGNHGQLATNIQVAESGRKLVDSK